MIREILNYGEIKKEWADYNWMYIFEKPMYEEPFGYYNIGCIANNSSLEDLRSRIIRATRKTYNSSVMQSILEEKSLHDSARSLVEMEYSYCEKTNRFPGMESLPEGITIGVISPPIDIHRHLVRRFAERMLHECWK